MYTILNACVTEEQLNDDWLLEHLKINEIEINNKDEKKDKDKHKGAFDDFFDLNMDDF